MRYAHYTWFSKVTVEHSTPEERLIFAKLYLFNMNIDRVPIDYSGEIKQFEIHSFTEEKWPVAVRTEVEVLSKQDIEEPQN